MQPISTNHSRREEPPLTATSGTAPYMTSTGTYILFSWQINSAAVEGLEPLRFVYWLSASLSGSAPCFTANGSNKYSGMGEDESRDCPPPLPTPRRNPRCAMQTVGRSWDCCRSETASRWDWRTASSVISSTHNRSVCRWRLSSKIHWTVLMSRDQAQRRIISQLSRARRLSLRRRVIFITSDVTAWWCHLPAPTSDVTVHRLILAEMTMLTMT